MTPTCPCTCRELCYLWLLLRVQGRVAWLFKTYQVDGRRRTHVICDPHSLPRQTAWPCFTGGQCEVRRISRLDQGRPAAAQLSWDLKVDPSPKLACSHHPVPR